MPNWLPLVLIPMALIGLLLATRVWHAKPKKAWVASTGLLR